MNTNTHPWPSPTASEDIETRHAANMMELQSLDLRLKGAHFQLELQKQEGTMNIFNQSFQTSVHATILLHLELTLKSVEVSASRNRLQQCKKTLSILAAVSLK